MSRALDYQKTLANSHYEMKDRDRTTVPASCSRQKTMGKEILTFIAAFFAGSGTWLTVTTLFAEGPFLVEYYNSKRLYSIMDLCVQLGNIGPLLMVTLFVKYNSLHSDSITLFLLVAGVASLFCSAFTWYNSIVVIASVSFIALPSLREPS